MLVNSSFELVPGLPIHTTRDLVTWTRTANAVDETMSHRLLIDGVEDSGGCTRRPFAVSAGDM